MDTTIHHRKLPLTTIAIFIGILAVGIIIFIKTEPASASGQLVLSQNENDNVQIISANSDDAKSRIDPGQDMNIGQCSARIIDNRITLKLYNSYPGYQCSLNIVLKNLGSKAVRLRQLAYVLPAELNLIKPDLSSGMVLAVQEETTLAFVLQVHQNAAENAKYRFSIDLIIDDLNRNLEGR